MKFRYCDGFAEVMLDDYTTLHIKKKVTIKFNKGTNYVVVSKGWRKAKVAVYSCVASNYLRTLTTDSPYWQEI